MSTWRNMLCARYVMNIRNLFVGHSPVLTDDYFKGWTFGCRHKSNLYRSRPACAQREKDEGGLWSLQCNALVDKILVWCGTGHVKNDIFNLQYLIGLLFSGVSGRFWEGKGECSLQETRRNSRGSLHVGYVENYLIYSKIFVIPLLSCCSDTEMMHLSI